MIAHCKDGLCNRMKAIASVVHTTDDYRIVWERVERSLNCDFDQLFDVPPFELLTAKQAKGQARYTGWRLLVHDDDRLPAGFDSLGDKLFGAIPLAGREPRGRNSFRTSNAKRPRASQRCHGQSDPRQSSASCPHRLPRNAIRHSQRRSAQRQRPSSRREPTLPNSHATRRGVVLACVVPPGQLLERAVWPALMAVFFGGRAGGIRAVYRLDIS